MKRAVRSEKKVDRIPTDAVKRQAETDKKPRNRFGGRLKKYTPALLATLLLIAGIIFFWPVNRAETLTHRVDFSTTNSNSSEYELGDTIVTQEGRPGERVATYSVRTNRFKMLFGIDGYKKEVSSKINVEPVDKVISKGTKKYQYMLCSDGSYRYYNDDQFKDPSIGFTSKSEDFCVKFNQGTKIKLADDSSGGVQYSPAAQSNPYSRQQPLDSSCTKSDVVKYKTIYRDDPYLAKGVQKTAIDGYDGYTFLCPSTGYKDIVAPYDAVVDVGTGEAAERRAEADRIADEQQRLNETNARNNRIAQCIRNMRVQIPQGGSALEYAISLCYSTP